jgi:hypothetical protein
MRAVCVGLIIAMAAVSQIAGQESVDRVLRFQHTETSQDVQEISTVIRSVADIRDVSADTDRRTAAVRGTPSQIALAEWLADHLDRPAGQAQTSTAQAYRLPGGADDVVRVFYVPKAETVQDLQEITVTVRSIAEIRRAFTYNKPRAVVLRGTASQVAMSAWLLSELADLAARSASREYRVADGTDDMIRIFYAKNVQSAEELQQLAVAVRSTTEIRRAFAMYKPRALILRSKMADIALAEWLMAALDKPGSSVSAGKPATQEYRVPGDDDVVAVYYVPRAETNEKLQQVAASTRGTTQIRRMFTYPRPRAVVARGTAAQIAAADRLFNEVQ